VSFLDTVGKRRSIFASTGASRSAPCSANSTWIRALDELVSELVAIQQFAVRNGQALEAATPSSEASATPVSPSGEPANRLTGSPAAGERRHLTVLFCAIRPADWVKANGGRR